MCEQLQSAISIQRAMCETQSRALQPHEVQWPRERAQRENIAVAVRCRPAAASSQQAWDVSPETRKVGVNPNAAALPALKRVTSELTYHRRGAGKLARQGAHEFDMVFDDAASTRQVYKAAAQQIVLSALDGVNGAVLAYGQVRALAGLLRFERALLRLQRWSLACRTLAAPAAESCHRRAHVMRTPLQPDSVARRSCAATHQYVQTSDSRVQQHHDRRARLQTGSGKTFTMLGDHMSLGIVTMALMDTLAETARRAPDTRFRVHASLVEIHNERIVDLFAAAEGRPLPERGVSIVVRALLRL
jgi:hypothetical protein